jgi:beta-alanine--pyruvate transaminase
MMAYPMNMNTQNPDLSAYWMPFTVNRDFKENPRLLVSVKGMYYRDAQGNPVLDGTASLWCVPLSRKS